MKKIIITIAIVVVVVGLGIALMLKGDKTISPPAPNTGLSADFNQLPSDSQLKANLAKAGLSELPAEGTKMHIHQHLDIIINGQTATVPAEVGIGTSFISELHTHDTSGMLHVESPQIKDFRLGQFFQEWGVKFDGSCISGYCADDTRKLIVAVNGQPITDPASHVLAAHEEIEIWYGLKTENPQLISSWNFPAGS